MVAQKKYKVAGIKDLREILEEQNYKCSMTGDKLEPDNCAYDHIVPLSKGGTSLKNNLQAVVQQVNISKSDMTMEEFVTICAKVIIKRGAEFGYKIEKLK